MLQSFLCVSRALLTSEEQMIHSDLLPPSHRAERTFGSRWSRKLAAGVLLFRSVSECAHRRWHRSQAQPFLLAKNHEGDRKEWGWDKGIQILDEEPGVLPAQAAHLLSLGRLEQPGAPRYTHRQAATPGTATRFGVPSQPVCSQPLFLWRYEKFCVPTSPFYPLFIFKWSWWMVCKSQQGAVVKENWPST